MKARIRITDGYLSIVADDPKHQDIIDWYLDSESIEMDNIAVEMEVIVDKGGYPEELHHVCLQLTPVQEFKRQTLKPYPETTTFTFSLTDETGAVHEGKSITVHEPGVTIQLSEDPPEKSPTPYSFFRNRFGNRPAD
jgi:hypothetical protein